MKKLLFIAVLLMSTMGLRAQESHFGVKLGLNRNAFNLTYDSSASTISPDDYKGKMGFEVGVISEFKLSDKFAVAPELLYASIGDHYEVSKETSGVKVEASGNTFLNYIQIPVMGRYYINDAFSLEFGPQIGILLSAESEYETKITYGGNTNTDSGNVKDYKKEIESTDFGFNLGTGYKLENGMFFNLRYTIGLSDIAKDKDLIIKNNTFRLGIGYFFN